MPHGAHLLSGIIQINFQQFRAEPLEPVSNLPGILRHSWDKDPLCGMAQDIVRKFLFLNFLYSYRNHAKTSLRLPGFPSNLKSQDNPTV